MSTTPESDIGSGIDFQHEQDSAEFTELRKTHRSFVFPMAVIFLLWYFAYVLLADYAHEFMSIKVWGNFNMGLLLGLLQFVSTFGITAAYVSYSNRKIDPKATAIRTRLEAQEGE
ncbi:MAG: DUF485 domain-containing protein [Paeniglutamicibacter terrestris]|jgi:uncharacterized membrane protein (DUF485 family)|uniref:DUF485 domain-containing protein n=1 Tax=Paeniglutamicibacter terrestris TaxID=2723403 RepID=A0ABX1G7W0_9MICC|nr:DUF485 domain-containing protein [Paeniglutamicibacter terrestris]ASN40075.1 hypothetical protein CGQ24_14360 [Arthrobacter sp. 7749]NKG22104.1 DUF485 domain-containing protein [Paeniglutamicibacter terrestris]